MLKNYLKIAVRQLFKNKTFSVINILGLVIGMTAFILLALFIQNEVSYDQFHNKKSRTYSLWNKAKWGEELKCWPVTPKVASIALREHFPEVEKVARVDWPQNRLIKCGERKFYSIGSIVDPEFLSIFDFPLHTGNVNSVFTNPNSIIITQELSEKLFLDENPIGKIVQLDNKENLTVTGVISTLPNNTRFDFEYLIPWKFLEKEGVETNWGNNSTSTFVLLKDNTTLSSIQPKIKTLRKDYSKDSDIYDMFLYPLERMRLHGNFENGVETGGRIETIKILCIIAGFILLIACINFMNLSTARSEKRAKEVGIRKTVGAIRSSIIKQFLTETIVISFVSFIIAIALVQLTLPAYNELVEKKLAIDYLNPMFWVKSILFILITGLLAGSYSAFYLSAFNPIVVLKGTFQKQGKSFNLRKVLVILQFVFAITLIISTIIVNQQMQYVMQRDAGYNKNQLIYHSLSEDLDKNYSLIKTELLQKNLALSVTKTSNPITQSWSNSWGFEWDGKKPDDKTIFDRFCVDENIVKTGSFQLVQGRDFNLQEYATDSSAVIINESALKVIGFKEPLGKIIKDGDEAYHIIGVVNDFILDSPYEPIRPMMILGAQSFFFNFMTIRLADNKNVKEIETLLKKYNPEYPVDIKFVDKEYAKKFQEIGKMGTLTSLFAVLTIFISCLGLFGLASYTAENRVKEIGVRKVLGASASKITIMLTSNFIKLVFLAFLIASPLSYWLLNIWLRGYSYHIDMQWWVFLLAGSLSVFIALITVVSQALKASTANPIKSLRTE